MRVRARPPDVACLSSTGPPRLGRLLFGGGFERPLPFCDPAPAVLRHHLCLPLRRSEVRSSSRLEVPRELLLADGSRDLLAACLIIPRFTGLPRSLALQISRRQLALFERSDLVRV